VDVGSTSAAVIRGAVLGALRRPDGPGVVSISEFLDGCALQFTKERVLRVPPSAATPIFNTHSVGEITRAMRDGTPVDNARRQVVMNPRLASTAVVRSSMALLCDLLFHVSGRPYEATEPTGLLTLPEAKPQMPFGDATDEDQLANLPRMISAVMAVENGSLLDTWPGTFCDFTSLGSSGAWCGRRWRSERSCMLGSCSFFVGTSSAAVPSCIWMSFAASHRISRAVHDIGTALDVL